MDYHALYDSIDDLVIRYRYNRYSEIEAYLKKFYERFDVDLNVVGESEKQQSIYSLRVGNLGPKILLWSQMHGNESTMTRALFLYLEKLFNSDLIPLFQLYIIPVLNPDANDLWIRNNSNDVDLNRDAVNLSQKESVVLRDAFNSFQPDYCFNLHDQRSIYGALDGFNSIPVSFLSPAGDVNKTITRSRIEAMRIINVLVEHLTTYSGLNVGRYDDTYNENCVGDYFASRHIPTVLFEAGQWKSNYNRDDIVISMAKALDVAIDFISDKPISINIDDVIHNYHSIPEISKSFCDVWIKDFPTQHGRVNLGVMYKEIIENDLIYYVPVLSSINDNMIKNGHRVIDCAKYEHDQMDIVLNTNQLFISELLNVNVIY